MGLIPAFDGANLSGGHCFGVANFSRLRGRPGRKNWLGESAQFEGRWFGSPAHFLVSFEGIMFAVAPSSKHLTETKPMNGKRIVVVIMACVSLSLLGALAIPAKVQPAAEFLPKMTQDEDLKSEARKQFMRGKLLSNQKIVEGLSLKDFGLVKEGAEGVTALVKGQHWFVLETEEYKNYSREMEQAARMLEVAAKDKNIEAAALRYFDLTLNCIDCHRYLETMNN